MKLLIASNNKGKVREFQTMLGEYFEEVVTPAVLGIKLDVEENGSTFMENALIKARAFQELTGLDTLADDSGLCVDALGGAPGVYSARYAGGHGDDEANNRLLLKNLEDVPEGQRSGRFVAALALVRNDGSTITAEAAAEGSILFAPRGENGFGYDPLFYTEVYNKSFAELTDEEKNAISHRGEAIKKLRAELEKLND